MVHLIFGFFLGEEMKWNEILCEEVKGNSPILQAFLE
jgi:hypothetical protein